MIGRMTRRLFLAASTLGLAALGIAGGDLASLTARAETPPDTLVQAALIDDIISLDPAEIFEFSGAEYGAQVYDGLISYDVTDVSKKEIYICGWLEIVKAVYKDLQSSGVPNEQLHYEEWT